MLSKKEFNRLFSYDKETGRIYWKDWQHNHVRAGDEAGKDILCMGLPYRAVTTRGKTYLAHRVIWVMNFGAIPQGKCIDHIDHNGRNNKLDNLRLVTRGQNQKYSR